ncbi:hypothetical protein DKU16_09680 [Salmonella enterica subsp. enterica serovar Potsdam]|nr:hypothetical protein [Salmonella enterica]EBU6951659.1 hypothetical protein [Salmonella enterica subsp. enterica serovar Potsdam]EKA3322651.1 hypothetical protein [Salmonella enterica]
MDYTSYIIGQLQVEDIIDAIKGVNNTNVIKDYVLPVVLPIISSVLSYFIATRLFYRQEYLKAQRRKVNVVNKCIYDYFSAMTTLLQIKGNYYGGVSISENPIERALAFPVVVFSGAPLSSDLSELACILSQKGVENNRETAKTTNWGDAFVVSDIARRFNSLLAALNVRNDFDDTYRGMIIESTGSPLPTMRFKNDDIVNAIGSNKAAYYIDITEQIMIMIDVLLLDINLLLKELPLYAESLFDKRVMQEDSGILKFNDLHERFPLLMKPVTPPSIKLMSDYLGYSEDEILRRYPYPFFNMHDCE